MNKTLKISLIMVLLCAVFLLLWIFWSKHYQTTEKSKVPSYSSPSKKELPTTYTTTATVLSKNGNEIIVEVPILKDSSGFVNTQKTVQVDSFTKFYTVSGDKSTKASDLTAVKPNTKIMVSSLEDIVNKPQVLATKINILQ